MSIANRKFTDMKQIEFQQSGSSRVEAMLTQPLLEKSSTYMCEITDLQATIGEELAFPENQWLFTVMKKPVHPAGPILPVNVHFYFRPENLEKYVQQLNDGFTDTTIANSEVFGIPHYPNANNLVWLGNQYYNNALGTIHPFITAFGTNDPYDEHTVYSRRYYSVLDFVSDIAMQVKQIDRTYQGNSLQPAVAWDAVDETNMYGFSLTVDSGGHLIFNMTDAFLNNYFIITSPLFQKVTGFPTFVGKYVNPGGDVQINTISDYEIHGVTDLLDEIGDNIFTDLNLNIATLTAVPPLVPLNPVGFDWVYKQFGPLFSSDGNLYLTARVHPEAIHVRDIIPVQDGVDVRKKLVVEVSLPISHTLCWDGQKETTKHVLQEFILPSGFVTMGYINGTVHNNNLVEMRQKQNQGQLVLLNGGSNLALKKLFEGQMQAFRVDLLLDYDRWDKIKQDYVRTVKQLDVGQGGFFYMKLLFTKETI